MKKLFVAFFVLVATVATVSKLVSENNTEVTEHQTQEGIHMLPAAGIQNNG